MQFKPPPDTIATFSQLYKAPQKQPYHTKRQKKISYNKRKGSYKHKPQLLSQLALSKRYLNNKKKIPSQSKINQQQPMHKEIHPATIFLSMIDDKRMPNAYEIIHKHYHILMEEEENRELYPQFEIAKNTHYNLRNLLAVNQINHVLLEKKNRDAGCYQCHRPKCQHTHGLLTETKTFTNQFSIQPYIIKYRLNCLSMGTVYMLRCLRCGKYYIGSTMRHFCDRAGEHYRGIVNMRLGKFKIDNKNMDYINLYNHFATGECAPDPDSSIDSGFDFIIIDSIPSIKLHNTAKIAYQQLDEKLNQKERFWIGQTNAHIVGLNSTSDWNNSKRNRRNYRITFKLSQEERDYWNSFWHNDLNN